MLIGPLPAPLLSVASAVPIALLLAGLTVLKWSARRAALTAFLTALVLSLTLFGILLDGLLVALAKGVLLSLYVLLVVWAALLLYSVADRLGAVESIGTAMANATSRPELRALMMAWGFSGFLQGIAGFGAPVAAVVPLLRIAGFPAVPAIAATMVGHSWAITFGSMGSSYFAILLVTRLPGEAVAPSIAALLIVPIFMTGASVVHILIGWQGLRRVGLTLAVVAAAIGASMWVMARLGAAQIASTVPALLGCALLWLAGRRSPATKRLGPSRLGFHMAFLPYYLLIAITLAVQLGPLAAAAQRISLGFDFPLTITALDYHVLPETGYPKLRVLQHPATLIALAIAGTALVYLRTGHWTRGAFTQSLRSTYQRSTASTVAVTLMVLMALVMSDSGMVRALAEGLRAVVGPAFPVLSPFLGVLGAFMTGSNTNSNIAMGALQVETAAYLGLAPWLIAAAQSVGGSLGSGISPDKALIAAAVARVQGQEGTITLKALRYGLLAVAVVGIEVLLFTILDRTIL